MWRIETTIVTEIHTFWMLWRDRKAGATRSPAHRDRFPILFDAYQRFPKKMQEISRKYLADSDKELKWVRLIGSSFGIGPPICAEDAK